MCVWQRCRRSPGAEISSCSKWVSNSNRLEQMRVLIVIEIGQSAAGQHLVALDQLKGFNIGGRGQTFIDRTEILVASRQKLLEALDHKVGLLEIVNGVFGTHDALEIKGDAVGRRAFKRKFAFGNGR